jgi:hypothetical protein
LQGLGLEIEAHLIKEAILTPMAFAGPDSVDAQASATIFGDLVARGVVDNTGKRLFRTDQPTITLGDQVALSEMLPSHGN